MISLQKKENHEKNLPYYLELAKNLFSRPDPVQGERTALLFAINDYPGSANDLRGCLNDQEDIAKRLKELWPDFIIHKYADSYATVSNFLNQLRRHVEALKPGSVLFIHYSGHGTQVYDTNGDESDGYDEALYLHDGPVADDRLNEILQKIPDGANVVLAMDCCFSGTITKAAVKDVKNRFVQTVEERPKIRIGGGLAWKSNMNWILLSGCQENQTSADALINGRYNGAFTFYFLRALRTGISYYELYNLIRQFLPNHNFSQEPTIEGSHFLQAQKVFE